MRSAITAGLGAGALSGLVLAWSGVLLRTSPPVLAHPIRYVAGVSQVTVAYLVIGSVLGLAFSVLVHAVAALLRRGSDEEARATFEAALPLLVGVGLIVFGAYYYGVRHAGSAHLTAARTWWSLSALSVVVLGTWLAIGRSRSEFGAGRLFVWGAGLLAGALGLLGAARAVAGKIERSGLPWPWLLICLVALAVGVAVACGVGSLLRVLMARLCRRHSPQVSACIVLAIPAGLLVAMAAAGLTLGEPAGVGRLPQREGPAVTRQKDLPSRPNAILISVDALRGDFVGYEGGPVKTPVIDKLAAESYAFANAYSVSPWTVPSFAAFFSGRYPSEMGVGRVRGMDDDAAPHTMYEWVWRTDRKLLAELFKDQGYATFAVATNAHLIPEAHADQGFEVFHHCSYRWLTRSPARIARYLAGGLLGNEVTTADDLERAEVVTARANEVIAQLPVDQPVLLWMHYMDPHAPYDPPNIPEDQQVRVNPDDKARMAAGRSWRTAVGRSKCIAAYASEVEYWDRWFGKLRDGLQARGLWDSSIVVLWSDHGEEFWEHGSFEHGQSLYNELLRVPLIIRLPGQTTGKRMGQPVSLLDVLPTLVELCGLESPEGLSGRSLTPLFGETPGAVDPFEVYLESCSYGPIRMGLLTDRYKLIHDVTRDTFSLYDLRDDPVERRDIFGTTAAPDTGTMERELADWSEEALAMMDEHVNRSGAGQLPPEARKRLMDMGYIR